MDTSLVDFSIIKQKIINTDEVLQMYMENDLKLKKAQAVNNNLKVKYDQATASLNRLQLENERYSFTSESTKSKFDDLQSENQQLMEQKSILEKKYNSLLVDSQSTILELQDELKMIKDLTSSAEQLSSPSPKRKSPGENNSSKELGVKFKKVHENEKKLKEDNEKLLLENKHIMEENIKVKTNHSRMVAFLQLEKSRVDHENRQLRSQIESEKQQHHIIEEKDHEISKLNAEVMMLRELTKQMKILQEQNQKLNFDLSYKDTALCNSLKKIHEIQNIPLVHAETQTNEMTSEPENVRSKCNSFSTDHSSLDTMEYEAVEHIFEEMIFSSQMVSPLRCPSPENCILDDDILEQGAEFPTSIPDIIITPSTPLKENQQSFIEITTRNEIFDMVPRVEKKFFNPENVEDLSENDKDSLLNKHDVTEEENIASYSVLLESDKKLFQHSDSGHLCKSADNQLYGEVVAEDKNTNLAQVIYCEQVKSLDKSKPIVAKERKFRKRRFRTPTRINSFMKQQRLSRHAVLLNKRYSFKKRLMSNRLKTQDSVLRALQVLKHSKINFTISNESTLPLLHEHNWLNNHCRESSNHVLPPPIQKVPQAAGNQLFQKLKCRSPCCNKMLMLLSGKTKDPDLHGFLNVKKEVVTPPESRLTTANPKDPLKWLNESLKKEITPENLLDTLAELVSKKLQAIKATKRKRRSTSNSEFYSETEPEIERLFQDPPNVLERNRMMLKKAKYDRDKESTSITSLEENDIKNVSSHISIGENDIKNLSSRTSLEDDMKNVSSQTISEDYDIRNVSSQTSFGDDMKDVSSQTSLRENNLEDMTSQTSLEENNMKNVNSQNCSEEIDIENVSAQTSFEDICIGNTRSQVGMGDHEISSVILQNSLKETNIKNPSSPTEGNLEKEVSNLCQTNSKHKRLLEKHSNSSPVSISKSQTRNLWLEQQTPENKKKISMEYSNGSFEFSVHPDMLSPLGQSPKPKNTPSALENVDLQDQNGISRKIEFKSSLSSVETNFFLPIKHENIYENLHYKQDLHSYVFFKSPNTASDCDQIIEINEHSRKKTQIQSIEDSKTDVSIEENIHQNERVNYDSEILFNGIVKLENGNKWKINSEIEIAECKLDAFMSDCDKNSIAKSPFIVTKIENITGNIDVNSEINETAKSSLNYSGISIFGGEKTEHESERKLSLISNNIEVTPNSDTCIMKFLTNENEMSEEVGKFVSNFDRSRTSIGSESTGQSRPESSTIHRKLFEVQVNSKKTTTDIIDLLGGTSHDEEEYMSLGLDLPDDDDDDENEEYDIKVPNMIDRQLDYSQAAEYSETSVFDNEDEKVSPLKLDTLLLVDPKKEEHVGNIESNKEGVLHSPQAPTKADYPQSPEASEDQFSNPDLKIIPLERTVHLKVEAGKDHSQSEELDSPQSPSPTTNLFHLECSKGEDFEALQMPNATKNIPLEKEFTQADFSEPLEKSTLKTDIREKRTLRSRANRGTRVGITTRLTQSLQNAYQGQIKEEHSIDTRVQRSRANRGTRFEISTRLSQSLQNNHQDRVEENNSNDNGIQERLNPLLPVDRSSRRGKVLSKEFVENDSSDSGNDAQGFPKNISKESVPIRNLFDSVNVPPKKVPIETPAVKRPRTKPMTKLKSNVMRQMKLKMKMFKTDSPIARSNEYNCDVKCSDIDNANLEIKQDTSVISMETPKEVEVPLVNKKIKVVQNFLIQPGNGSPVNLLHPAASSSQITSEAIESEVVQTKRKVGKAAAQNHDVLSRILGDMDRDRPAPAVKPQATKKDVPAGIDEKQWRKRVLDIAEIVHSKTAVTETTMGLQTPHVDASGLLKKGGRLTGNMNLLVRKLMNISNEEEIPRTIILEFKKLNIDFVIDIIIHEVAKDFFDEPVNKYYPAPLMTRTQRIYLSLLVTLEKEVTDNVLEKFLSRTQTYILRIGCSIQAAIPLTRLFLSVCRLKADIRRMRLFCCEAFFYVGDLAVPIFFTVLTSWAEVIPMLADVDNYPIAKVLVQLVQLKTFYVPGYNLRPLRCLLHQYYGYPKDRRDCDEFFDEVFQHYLRNPTPSSDFAIRLYCRNKDSKWVYKKINELFKPLIYKIPMVNVNFKSTAILLLGKLCRQFRVKDDHDATCLVELNRFFSGLYEDDMPDLVRQSVSLSIDRLPKAKKNQDKKHDTPDLVRQGVVMRKDRLPKKMTKKGNKRRRGAKFRKSNNFQRANST